MELFRKSIENGEIRMESHTYQAFISYRHKPLDIAVAKAIHSKIENYRLPAHIKKQSGIKKVGRCFRDQDELPTSSDLSQDIMDALNNSSWLIVVCTPDTPESKWCLTEIETFIRMHGRSRVLAVLAAGEPEDSFPPILRFETSDDGTPVEREPLAADLRAGSIMAMKRKLRIEKLRLIAPILGVAFDDLRRRARERTLRIVVAASAAAALFFAVFGGYALNQASVISRQNSEIAQKNDDLTTQIAETEKQRELAVINEAEAVKQAGIAEVNATEARKQAGIAQENEEEARKQAGIAQENEARAIVNEMEAKRQAGIAISNEELARENEALALLNEAEAKRQSEIAVSNERLAKANEAEANRQAGIARNNEVWAYQERDEAFMRQSLFLSSLSQERAAAGDTNTALLLALEALPNDLAAPDRPYTFEAEAALRQAMLPSVKDGFTMVAGSRVGTMFIDDMSVRLSAKGYVVMKKSSSPYYKLVYNVYTGELLYSLPYDSDVEVSPDGKYITYTTDAGVKDEQGKDMSLLTLIGPGGKNWTVLIEGPVTNVTSFHFTTGPGPGDGLRLSVNRGNYIDHYVLDEDQASLTKIYRITGLTYFELSPDGTRMLVRIGRNISIVDASTGEVLKSLLSNIVGSTKMTWSADSKWFCIWSEESIQVWDAVSLQPLTLPDTPQYETEGRMEFSPDGSKLAVVGWDGYLRTYRTRDGTFLNTVLGIAAPKNLILSWSEDGRMVLFSCFHFNTHMMALLAWDATEDGHIPLLDNTGKDVIYASFIPGTNDIAVIQYDRAHIYAFAEGTHELEFRVWRMADRRSYTHISSILPSSIDGSRQVISNDDLRWTTDGRYVYIKTARPFDPDSPLKNCGLFDPLTLEAVNTTPVNTYSLDYSPSGRYAIIFDSQADVREAYGIFDTLTKKKLPLQRPDYWEPQYADRIATVFSPDETKVLYGLGIFDVQTGALLFSFDEWQQENVVWSSTLFRWSEDSGRFACYSFSLKTYWYIKHESPGVYDANTFTKLYGLNDQGDVFDVAFSPDGKRVAVWSGYKTANVRLSDMDVIDKSGVFVEILDGYNGDMIVEFPSGDLRGFQLCWSPDGRILATHHGEGKLVFYDTSTWEELYTLISQGGLPQFSLDSRFFIAKDGTLFSAATGKTLIRGWGYVTAIDTVGGLYNASLTPDGSRYVDYANGVVRVCDIEPLGELMFKARQWLNGRELTDAERKMFFLE